MVTKRQNPILNHHFAIPLIDLLGFVRVNDSWIYTLLPVVLLILRQTWQLFVYNCQYDICGTMNRLGDFSMQLITWFDYLFVA